MKSDIVRKRISTEENTENEMFYRKEALIKLTRDIPGSVYESILEKVRVSSSNLSETARFNLIDTALQQASEALPELFYYFVDHQEGTPTLGSIPVILLAGKDDEEGPGSTVTFGVHVSDTPYYTLVQSVGVVTLEFGLQLVGKSHISRHIACAKDAQEILSLIRSANHRTS